MSQCLFVQAEFILILHPILIITADVSPHLTRMCSVHADSIGEVALDDITLWANCCTKCDVNTISHFHLIVHYVTGAEVFTGNYIL